MRPTIAVLLLALTFAVAQAGDDGVAADPAELKVFYGLLHAHTSFSDGSGTPEEAYGMARDAGLGFFAVTPHNHITAEDGAKDRKDGVLIAKDHRLYNSVDPVPVRREVDGNIQITQSKSVIRAAKDATNDRFSGLWGQEFSTISSGNHINVFNVDDVITTDSGDFAGLFEYLRTHTPANGLPVVVQLNHPDVHADLFYKGNSQSERKKMFNDYGIDVGDLGPDFKHLVEVEDPFVTLIEVLSGPAMKKAPIANYSYRDQHENDYYFYLVQGFHIGPTAGQDNHYKTWGTVTDARTGVYAKSPALKDILEGLKESRTFATEDKDLSVKFTLNGKYMLGDAVTLEAGTALNFSVVVNDSDELNAEYEVSLVYGDVQTTDAEHATDWKASDAVKETKTVSAVESATFNGYMASGKPEFFYAKIVQDSKDRAWTAPIWINHPKPGAGKVFYWSEKSKAKVYHVAGCPSVGQIKPDNLQSGVEPPEGWKPHNCTPASSSDEEGH